MSEKCRYKINGVYVTAEQFAAHKPGDPLPTPEVEERKSPLVMRAWEKEFHSESLGESPHRLKWLKQEDQIRGVGDTCYDEQGRPVFTSKKKWERYKKAHGYHDRDKVSGKRLTNEIDGTILQRIMDRFSLKED